MFLNFSSDEKTPDVQIFGVLLGEDGQRTDYAVTVHENGFFANLAHEELRTKGQGTIFLNTTTDTAEILKPGDARLRSIHKTAEL